MNTFDIIFVKKEGDKYGKKSNKVRFKEMRWMYMIFAVLGIIFGIATLAVPGVSEAIKNAAPNLVASLGGMDLNYYLFTIFFINALLDIWYFYLITRCADGKSKGTLLLVLLSLRVITAIVAIFTTNTPMSLDAITDAVTLIFLIYYRKENN